HASAHITPPAYAGADAGTEFVAGARDLGAGRTDMPSIAPVLAGSSVELVFDLNKPVPVPASASVEAQLALARALMQGTEPPAVVEITPEPASLKIGWNARDSIRFGAVLQDEYGIKSPDPAFVSVLVMPDRAPTVSVIDPAQDESILSTAVLD